MVQNFFRLVDEILFNLKIKDILGFLEKEVNYVYPEVLDWSVTGISVNSKKVKKGTLFVPLKGEKTDGHRYIEEAFSNGAVASLCEKDFLLDDVFFKSEKFPIIKVDDTLKTLQRIGFLIREKFKGRVIGVTGSCGKTTTKECVFAVLGESFKVFRNEGNLNGQIGVPLTLFCLNNTYDLAIIEMGISKFGEMDILDNIVRPDVAIITNVGHSHIEYLKSLENIFEEKFKITNNFSEDNILFLNGDDPLLLRAKSFKVPFKIITFGINSENLDLKALNIEESPEKTVFDVSYKGKLFKKFIVNAVGEHILKDILAAISVGFYFNVDESKIKSALLKLRHFRGRQNIKKIGILDKNSDIIRATFIDDSYNANPESMQAAVNVLASVGKGKRKIAVLADMLEQGEKSKKSHENLGDFLAKKNIDLLITLGEYSKFTDEVFNKVKKSVKSYHFGNIDDIYTFLKNTIQNEDVVLFKGSRGFHLENLINKFFIKRVFM